MRRSSKEVASAYIGVTIDGDSINEDLVDAVDAAGPGIEKAGEEHGERYGEGFSDGFLDWVDGEFTKEFNKSVGSKMERSGEEGGRSFTDGFVRHFDDLRGKLTTELDSIQAHANAMRDSLSRATSANRRDTLTESLKEARAEATRLSGQIRTLGKEEEKLFLARAKAFIDAKQREARKSKAKVDVPGFDLLPFDQIGRFFGEGSRNNALNLIGKTIGNLAGGFQKLIDLAQVFGRGGGGAAFTKMFSDIAASGPAAVAAIGAVVVAMTVLVTVASGLLGVITALAATITSALVGALTVGAAAFGAIGVAAGLATLAFFNMNKEQKKLLSDAFKPIGEAAKGLGQIIVADIVPAFDEWADGIGKVLVLAEPLARVMGGAFARAGTLFTKSLSGDGVRMFIASLTEFLPRITTNLSAALGGFINGISGIFAASMPFVLRFAQYLNEIATRFANWATSLQGQNAITDFVSRALESLRSLMGFLGAVGGLIAKVLFNPAVQQTGNNIFDKMAASLRKFVNYLSEDNRLERWMGEAEKTANLLGDTIRTVSVALAQFNAPAVLSFLSGLASAAERVVTAFDNLPAPIKAAILPLAPLTQMMLDFFNGVVKGAAAAVKSFGFFLVALAQTTNAASNVPFIGDAFDGLTSNIVGAANAVFALSNQIADIPNRDVIINVKVRRLVEASAGLLGPVVNPRGAAPKQPKAVEPKVDISGLGNIGRNIGGGGGGGGGGSKGGGGKKGYKNPYVAFANRLINEGPSVLSQIRTGLRELNFEITKTILEATRSVGGDAAKTLIGGLVDTMRTEGKSMVDQAQQALNSAAQSLASASSKKEAKKALRETKAAQAALKEAQANQKRINAAAAVLAKQQVVHAAIIAGVNDSLKANDFAGVMHTLKASNATLADFAEARSLVADAIEKANTKLGEAISLRDDYLKQVSESVKAFGALTTATASTVNGIEQSLSANDITTNLQERLDKIRKFQDNLRVLVAQGLSNDAYKQIVDSGVEAGSAFVDALIAGGPGAVGQVNSLVGQIGGIADQLGLETSSRLYQAGVDAAQGLVDGLTSLSAELDAAATQLGLSIAAAIKKSLGIKSPSTVLIADMDHVGDGAVIGLDNQHAKVSRAAARFSDQIRVSPEVAAYAASQGQSASVSGNQPNVLIDLDITTPTEDPHAVANEVINEVVGRLP